MTVRNTVCGLYQFTECTVFCQEEEDKSMLCDRQPVTKMPPNYFWFMKAIVCLSVVRMRIWNSYFQIWFKLTHISLHTGSILTRAYVQHGVFNTVLWVADSKLHWLSWGNNRSSFWNVNQWKWNETRHRCLNLLIWTFHPTNYCWSSQFVVLVWDAYLVRFSFLEDTCLKKKKE